MGLLRGDAGTVAVVDFDVALKIAFTDHPLIPKKALNSAEMAESM